MRSWSVIGVCEHNGSKASAKRCDRDTTIILGAARISQQVCARGFRQPRGCADKYFLSCELTTCAMRTLRHRQIFQLGLGIERALPRVKSRLRPSDCRWSRCVSARGSTADIAALKDKSVKNSKHD